MMARSWSMEYYEEPFITSQLIKQLIGQLIGQLVN